MLFDSRKEAALASSVIDQHIFFTTPYSLLWARAHNNEKGRVERAIRFVRENFFAARKFVDLDDLNAQAAL
ncbi:putative transposase [Caballeronia sordidicola]|uniref:Putative transposase n=1 Tax=Caballeronia sordidicola TaxID=196367 RepID=A0A242N6H7_CABSO|nr:putative transposase [Caballeronia sordidicola]